VHVTVNVIVAIILSPLRQGYFAHCYAAR